MAVFETKCDIFAPCALGGVLNANTIPQLKCRAVAGGANNQLAGPEDAERIRVRGFLFVTRLPILYTDPSKYYSWPMATGSTDRLERRLGLYSGLPRDHKKGERKWQSNTDV